MTTLMIAYDLDSVLVNFHSLALRAYKELFPERKTPKYCEWNSFDFKDFMQINDNEIEFMLRYIRRAGFYDQAAPCDQSFDHFLKKQTCQGHELKIITKNPPWMESTIKSWLSNFGLEYIPIYFVTEMKDKLQHEFDVIIDDSEEVYDAMKEDKREFIFYTHWQNRQAAREYKLNGGRISRNHAEVFDHIQQIARNNYSRFLSDWML